jgi:Putative peptidoglycan binding domain
VTRDTTSQAVLEDFIRQFGNSVYGSMARARLEELKMTQVATAPFDQELGRSLQFELKRVGCYQGAVNGEFGNATREALRSFVKYSALNLRNEDLSVDAIKAVRSFDKRVCPLSCQPGERAEGDTCIRVTAGPARLQSGSKKCFSFQGREFCE